MTAGAVLELSCGCQSESVVREAPRHKLFNNGLGCFGVVAFNAAAVACHKTGADHLQELKNFDGPFESKQLF